MTTLFTPADPATVTRRHVLQGLLGLGATSAISLPWLLDATRAAAGPPLGPNERILVTVMMGGGNDGLNTLIPLEDGNYHDLRGAMAVTETEGATLVGEGLYLHPNLARLRARYDRGDVAIVRGVGEVGLDHSHFICMAKWMAGQTAGIVGVSGWLGRYLDGRGADGFGGVSIGDHGVPLHLRRVNGSSIGLPTYPDLFGSDMLTEEGTETYNAPMYTALQGLDDVNLGIGAWAQNVAVSQAAAIGSAQQLRPTYEPEIPEPTWERRIVRDLTLAARLINLDLGVRVVSAGFGDFDTHDNQRPRHDNLLAALDEAIETFFATLSPALRDRVVLMTFSEFGRRPETNGSVGVDHGTASCLFVCGTPVTGGLYGQQPGLGPRQLDDRGDLEVHVDFRSVYATVLDKYLGADAAGVLGADYGNVGFFDAPPPDPDPTPTADPTATPGPEPTPTPGPGRKPRCGGERATIVGTRRGDRLVGTPGDDVIYAGRGKDKVNGRGGDDIICGGAGNDRLKGGPGADRLIGGKGRDRLILDASDTTA